MAQLLPDAVWVRFLKARTQVYVDPADALVQLKALWPQLQPPPPEFACFVALAHWYQGDPETAMHCLRQRIDKEPNDRAAPLLLKDIIDVEFDKRQANEVFAKNQWQPARSKYTSILTMPSVVPNKNLRAVLYCNRAATEKELGLFKEAIADCNAAIHLNPKYGRAYQRRGRIYLTLKQREQALKDFDQAQTLGVDCQTEIRQLRAPAAPPGGPAPIILHSHYDTLELSSGASIEEVKRAYRKLALKYHPDKTAELPDKERVVAEKKFKLINEAYAVLSDEVKRHTYDQMLGAGTRPTTANYERSGSKWDR
eukprot:TRINITY_DN10918_c0_g1_i4.p2 TRINITY_DN10918_c0_g1~~TRINITY_DN10918_c0_g1_i4.p2  ORF type:complete len:311 (+),score=60.52 TRINITY_DN10918_c0_g1_i4:1095-2027(+)